MRKKIKILFVLILAITFTSGCTYGSSFTLFSKEVNTSSKMSMSYKKFSGYKATDLRVKEGEAVEVSVDIVSKEGKLDLTIVREAESNKDASKNQKDETVYTGNDLPTSDFKVTLDKPGKYIIKVTGEKHSGSYKITWDKAEKPN